MSDQQRNWSLSQNVKHEKNALCTFSPLTNLASLKTENILDILDLQKIRSFRSECRKTALILALGLELRHSSESRLISFSFRMHYFDAIEICLTRFDQMDNEDIPCDGGKSRVRENRMWRENPFSRPINGCKIPEVDSSLGRPRLASLRDISVSLRAKNG